MLATGTIERIDARAMAREPAVQILSLRLADPFPFAAGQYLEVLHPEGTAIPLSIASPPERLPWLTLHYRSTPGAAEAERMDELIRQGRPLTLRGPGGAVRLAPEDGRPLLLVSGGTGISQALGLATAQRQRHPTTAVALLACADDPADFYFEDLLPGGLNVTLIADPARDSSNRALIWLTRHAPSLPAAARVILSGSPGFVWAATDTLTGCGRAAASIESDVYAWSPRP
ncbi:MAG TPA: hypothetical protein VIS76_04045 [Pseudomonadales bacterium]